MKNPTKQTWSAAFPEEPGAGGAIWDLIEDYGELDSRVDVDSAWNKVSNALHTAKPVKKRAWKKYLVAASVAIATLFLVNQLHSDENNFQQRYQNSGTADQMVALADESQVMLMPESSLEFAMNDDSRRATLVGRATFDIEKDDKMPFTVEGEGFELVVVGTKFTIKTGKQSSINVHEGIVRVRGTREADWITLVAGESAMISNQLAKKLSGQGEKTPLKVENLKISELSKQFKSAGILDLSFSNKISDCTITADFTGDSPAEIAKTISVLFSAELSISNNKYKLIGGSCQ